MGLQHRRRTLRIPWRANRDESAWRETTYIIQLRLGHMRAYMQVTTGEVRVRQFPPQVRGLPTPGCPSRPGRVHRVPSPAGQHHRRSGCRLQETEQKTQSWTREQSCLERSCARLSGLPAVTPTSTGNERLESCYGYLEGSKCTLLAVYTSNPHSWFRTLSRRPEGEFGIMFCCRKATLFIAA